MNPEHFDYTLTVDDKEYKGNTSMLVIANGLILVAVAFHLRSFSTRWKVK